MSSPLKQNTTTIQNLLNTINSLPEAGADLPELTNEGSASDLLSGKELIDADGNKVTGTFTIDNELNTQDDLIAQIQTALQNKASAELVLQTKTVIPTINPQSIIPDSGFDGLSQVIVNAIPIDYIIPSGTLIITTSGTHDVKNYESAIVNVEGSSSEDTEILDDLVSGNIASYSNDAVTTVRDGLFMRCTKLTTASFPAATKINQYAFYQCSNLTTVSFPACTSIGDNAFGLCSNIVNVNFPVCATVGMSAFGSCYKLVSLSLPQCTSIANYAIARCSAITSLDLPVCKTIGVSAFRECPKLTTVSMPAVTSIPAGVFSKCFNLKSLYLTGSILCTLANSNAFASTPIGGYSTSAHTYGSIYVPASMLASYQAATNWTYFSNRMVGV